MKVVIVNCFDTYEDRVDLLYEFFKDQKYDVKVIQSNFRHIKKIYREDDKENFIFVKSKKYYKNLSISRLSSHYKFAKDAFKIVEKLEPDILYTFVPPNSLAKFSAIYKQKHKEVKLILDLIDLWPETMPIGKLKNFIIFKIWGQMRDKSLKFSDLVITECDLYQNVLEDVLKDINKKTIYLAKKDIQVVSKPQLSDEEIHLAYLGSINNIIDISKIKEIIEEIKNFKPVILHIIGDGESKEELIEAAKLAGADVKYYGKIYDPQEKQDIFDKCHFGLNIMKDSVCVGLTMKSIDYFQHGIPILNNIPADTAGFVKEYNVGINYFDKNEFIEEIKKKGIFEESNLIMIKNALKLFEDCFSEKYFKDKLDYIYKQIK